MEQEAISKSEFLEKFQRFKSDSFDVICKLSQLVEYKTEHRGYHNKRMGYYAATIAKKMGFDEIYVENMLYAAPMHDIGKIGIPDDILLKPEKLNKEEWQIMRLHTVIGERILKDLDVEFAKLAAVIALTHHEKSDGTGYPSGHQGIDIPIAGRIVAVVDVFDSLTSERPYRDETFSLDEAFDIIGTAKGSHFDPEVVDVFFSHRDELMNIKETYKKWHQYHT